MGELQVRMSAAELAEWEALRERQPWGREREDRRFARLGHALVAAMAGRKAAKKAPPSFFVPPLWEDAEPREAPATPEDPYARNRRMAEKAKALTRQMGGEVIERGGE